MKIQNSAIRIVITLVVTLCASQLSAQTAAANYRQVRNEGGLLHEITRNILGNIYAGNIIEEIPGGSILEVTPVGNGYFKAKSYKTGKEGLLTGSLEIDQESIDPQRAVGLIFEFYQYEQEYPSLGDLPKSKHYVVIQRSDNGAPDEALISHLVILNPDTKEESEIRQTYYGRFLPYCVSLTSVLRNGVREPIDENRIYLDAHNEYSNGNQRQSIIDAIYIDGNRWNLVKN